MMLLQEPLQALGLSVEELPDPIGQGVEAEAWNAKHAAGRQKHVSWGRPSGQPRRLPGLSPALMYPRVYKALLCSLLLTNNRTSGVTRLDFPIERCFLKSMTLT